MFRLLKISAILLLLTGFTAGSQSDKLSESQIKKLITCIESENDGVRSWGVFFAGKYQVDIAVDHLIKILNCDNCKEIRKLAAYSLFRIGDQRGLKSLRDYACSNGSPEIRGICDSLYCASMGPLRYGVR